MRENQNQRLTLRLPWPRWYELFGLDLTLQLKIVLLYRVATMHTPEKPLQTKRKIEREMRVYFKGKFRLKLSSNKASSGSRLKPNKLKDEIQIKSELKRRR